MNTLHNKRILLGICGSIAAYKSADLSRRLREAGAEVRVVMTAAAMEFITPLTLQAVSGNPVHSDLLDATAEAAMGHIELARWAELILIAPASADCIARLSHGRADDLLSAICLASKAPLVLAPAMNQAMWSHVATQANIETLRDRGVNLFGPASGSQACGDVGPGRMLEPDQLTECCQNLFRSGILNGLHVLISAGPTREPIDPVRYLSNRSSGKMGFALAAAAAEAGASVTLISGPVQLTTPEQVKRVDVETAAQMYQAVQEHTQGTDIFIGAAAVADYRPGLEAVSKIKKTRDQIQLRLVRTRDILASVAALPDAPFTVGFAAETDRVMEYARTKLEHKKLDMVIANRVGPGLGFDQDDNELDIIWPDGHMHLELDNKKNLARKLVSIIAERFHANDTIENTGQETR